MTIALTVLFRAFGRYLASHPNQAKRHRFHFIGTDYAPPPLGRYWALPVAENEAVTAYVAEHCYRVPYFDALHYLAQSSSLIVVGSNDPTYSASKIFPYLLTQRPMIVIAHADGLMIPLARAEGLSNCYAFKTAVDIDGLVDEVYQNWFVNLGHEKITDRSTNQLLLKHGAEAMTLRLTQIFNTALELPRLSV